ncbi:MAG: hypothetical protein ACP5H5_04775 [Pyrobaculum sp.]|jgi:hypothetical protein
MYRAAIATAALVLLLLYLTPSTTPFSPYNTGPDGLSKAVEMCRVEENADVFIVAPGASVPGLNVTAGTSKIVDPLINAGDPYIPLARAGRYAVIAPNATPLRGPGRVVVSTSPTSFADTSRGPYALGLAVAVGNRTIYIYHASLFTNRAVDRNLKFIQGVCRRPVKVVVAGGDLSHTFHEAAWAIGEWLAPMLITAISLYLFKTWRTWPRRRES